ncbi:MAG: hypothetical protein COB24_08590 [Hyphomicrobiales bacterium]|nr:MAG: hypothetical protein COB24_08590 [Hyphomicrobiales bacterium]
MHFFVRLWPLFLSFALLSISTSVRSLRSLATPNGDAQSRLPQPKGFGPFSQDRQYGTKNKIQSLHCGTYTRRITKLELTKLNVIDWGGELASDQRLSGLASDTEYRARSAKHNANFQSINKDTTRIQSITKHQLTKRNAVDWGAEFTSDQRLSGLS